MSPPAGCPVHDTCRSSGKTRGGRWCRPLPHAPVLAPRAGCRRSTQQLGQRDSRARHRLPWRCLDRRRALRPIRYRPRAGGSARRRRGPSRVSRADVQLPIADPGRRRAHDGRTGPPSVPDRRAGILGERAVWTHHARARRDSRPQSPPVPWRSARRPGVPFRTPNVRTPHRRLRCCAWSQAVTSRSSSTAKPINVTLPGAKHPGVRAVARNEVSLVPVSPARVGRGSPPIDRSATARRLLTAYCFRARAGLPAVVGRRGQPRSRDHGRRHGGAFPPRQTSPLCCEPST